LVALIVPRYEALKHALQLDALAPKDLANHPAVLACIRAEIDRETAECASYEKIKAFRLLSQELTQASGELTPTLKIKRRLVSERYAADIEALYTEAQAARKKVAVNEEDLDSPQHWAG
jgi:long-chain acyl-CoA synthetase